MALGLVFLKSLTVADDAEVRFASLSLTELVKQELNSTEVDVFDSTRDIFPFFHLANELDDVHHADLLFICQILSLQRSFWWIRSSLTFITRQL